MQFILKLTRKLYKSGGRKFDVEATFTATIMDTILGRNSSNTLLKDLSGMISRGITGVEASEKLNCLFWYFIQKSSRPHSIQITLNYRFIKKKIKMEIRGKKKSGPVMLLSQLVKNSEGSTTLYSVAQVRHDPRIQNMVEPCMTVTYVCFQQNTSRQLSLFPAMSPPWQHSTVTQTSPRWLDPLCLYIYIYIYIPSPRIVYIII